MNVIRKTLKPTSICVTVVMFLMFAPVHAAMAAMIGTQTMIDSARGQQARELLHQLLARSDVQEAIIAQGIDPVQAQARIDALSDAEVIRVADHVKQLPAGGGAVEFVLIVSLVAFLVLVILDIAGVTDIFPFIKAQF